MDQVTIDLITHNPKDDKFAMILVAEGPWPDEDIVTKLRELQDRLYNCVFAAIDGQLAGLYPDSKGKDVVIRIDCFDTSVDEAADFFARFSKHIMKSEEIQDDLRAKAFVSSLSFEYSRGTLKEGEPIGSSPTRIRRASHPRVGHSTRGIE